MKFSGKTGDGTSNEPLNFGSKLLPCRRFALSECTLRAKICALRVLLVTNVTSILAGLLPHSRLQDYFYTQVLNPYKGRNNTMKL